MFDLLDLFDLLVDSLGLPFLKIISAPFIHRRNVRSIEGARRIALEKGVGVREAQREVNRKYIGEPDLPKETFAGYYIKHRTAKNSNWSLLQRSYSKVSEYPGRHSPVVKKGEITPELDTFFRQLTSDILWQIMFIEVDCNEEEVCIYWDERGGEEVAKKVIDYLFLVSKNTP